MKTSIVRLYADRHAAEDVENFDAALDSLREETGGRDRILTMAAISTEGDFAVRAFPNMRPGSPMACILITLSADAIIEIVFAESMDGMLDRLNDMELGGAIASAVLISADGAYYLRQAEQGAQSNNLSSAGPGIDSEETGLSDASASTLLIDDATGTTSSKEGETASIKADAAPETVAAAANDDEAVVDPDIVAASFAAPDGSAAPTTAAPRKARGTTSKEG